MDEPGEEAHRAGLGSVFVDMLGAISTARAMRSRKFVYDHERELAVSERNLREQVLSDLEAVSSAADSARSAKAAAFRALVDEWGFGEGAVPEELSRAHDEIIHEWFSLHANSWELIDVETLKRVTAILTARAAIRRAEAAVLLKAVEIRQAEAAGALGPEEPQGATADLKPL